MLRESFKILDEELKKFQRTSQDIFRIWKEQVLNKKKIQPCRALHYHKLF